MKKLLLFLLVQISVFAYELRECYIQDPIKHEENRQLLQEIIEEELDTSPEDPATYLSERINEIGVQLVQNGFHPDAYAVPEIDEYSVVSFDTFTLWEGKKHSIPLTFFLYIWPTEQFALRYHPESPENWFYASCIHSHPIPCAFTVLKGALTQSNYEAIDKKAKTARMIDKRTLIVGEGEVDDTKGMFIHRMINQGNVPCLSLHAYGELTAKEVSKQTVDFQAEHIYECEEA
ncbi:MAG: hypothetical protein JSS30_03435 [Verrucomicrobia bacterium]|nr:hypothetical protein [Verrucomicrobiota bacterium]